MPNLWTKATQKIAESFSGPRTKDTEFDMKVDEMKLVEKGVLSLKLVFQNFLNYTVSLRTLCRDISNSVKNVYDKKSPYYAISHDIAETHSEMERYYEEFYNNVLKLNSRTSEWAQLFANAKSQIEKRDQCRKTYDHYDEKMEKIYRGKQDKSKKVSETTKEVEFLQRNETKYRKATEEYVKISETTFETIQAILDKRYDMINPVVCDFLEEERVFFGCVGNIFKKFENVNNKFKLISSGVQKTPITYDACKYIRGGEIIQKEKPVIDYNPTRRRSSDGVGLDSNKLENNVNVGLNSGNQNNQEFRQRSKSNMPNRQEIEQQSRSSVNLDNSNIQKRDMRSNTVLIPNENARGSEYLYQEFSGINDQFSNNQIPHQNVNRNYSNTVYAPQSEVRYSGNNNNNFNIVNNPYPNNNLNDNRVMNDFESFDFGFSNNISGNNKNARQSVNNNNVSQPQNSFRMSTPNNQTQIFNKNQISSQSNNPMNQPSNNFNFSNIGGMTPNGTSNSKFPQKTGNNHQNNNFDFDNIFSNNISNTSNIGVFNMNNMTSAPTNLGFGQPQPRSSHDFNFNVSPNNISNLNNTINLNNMQRLSQVAQMGNQLHNNNPKGNNNDIFKDLF